MSSSTNKIRSLAQCGTKWMENGLHNRGLTQCGTKWMENGLHNRGLAQCGTKWLENGLHNRGLGSTRYIRTIASSIRTNGWSERGNILNNGGNVLNNRGNVLNKETKVGDNRRYIGDNGRRPYGEKKAAGKLQEVEFKKVVTVIWDDGTKGWFPLLWLRDNCLCEQCYSKGSQSRKQLMRDLDMDITAKEVDISGDGVSIEWKDGHLSKFDSDWLKQRTEVTEPRIPRELWYGNFLKEVERYKYKLLVEDDEEMLSFLENLARHGFVVIEEMPGSLHEMRSFYNKVGILKPTHYGDDWNIESQYDPNNLAYSSAHLGLHTDLPFYSYTPSTELIHCIRQHRGPGGENQFVDGFAVAEAIREHHPDAWKVLTTVPVEFWDKGKIGPESNWLGTYRVEKFHKVNATPTIRLNEKDEIEQICYNNAVRSTNKLANADTTIKLYKSFKLFDDLCRSEEFMIEMKLRDGDAVWFDNMRVLHGRTGFQMKEGDKEGRHMQGVYIDWDEIYSTINVLREKPSVQKQRLAFKWD